jgi:hypothetical protein
MSQTSATLTAVASTAVTCMNCGEDIAQRRTASHEREWWHLHRNTSTGLPHRTCGYNGTQGTSAEPAGGQVQVPA